MAFVDNDLDALQIAGGEFPTGEKTRCAWIWFGMLENFTQFERGKMIWVSTQK